MNYVLGVIFIAIGVFMIAKPDVCWDIQNMFSTKDGEPSDYYIIMTRVFSIVYFGLGIAMFLWNLDITL